MSYKTILDIQSKIEEVAKETNLTVINENMNSLRRDPSDAPFARYIVFDSEQQIGSIDGSGNKADVEVGNVIIAFFDMVDRGQQLYEKADLFRSRFDDQFNQIKFKIFRVETLGIVERDRGLKPSNNRNGLVNGKGWFRIDLRMTFEKYFC